MKTTRWVGTVVFDPLDGSSNIDVGVSIGTFWNLPSRRRNLSQWMPSTTGSYLGRIGYIVRVINCFDIYIWQNRRLLHLDPASGEFFLTRRDVRMPQHLEDFVSECNQPYWPRWADEFVRHLKGRNNDDRRNVSGCHIGSLVVDFHRNLVKGGTYLYPVDRNNKRGKLRLCTSATPSPSSHTSLRSSIEWHTGYS